MCIRAERRLLDANWGDDVSSSGEILNKDYKEELYSGDALLSGMQSLSLSAGLSAASKQSLQMVNEDRIDFDLMEQLIVNIDTCNEEGAILVFLPGLCLYE